MNGKQTAVMAAATGPARSHPFFAPSMSLSLTQVPVSLCCPSLHFKGDITKMKTLPSSHGLNVCIFLSFCALVSFSAATIMVHMIWYKHFPSPLAAPTVRQNRPLHTTTGLFITQTKKMMTVSSVVHNSSAPLGEFQSILDETVQQLLVLKNSRDEASLPVVTAVKCPSLWEDNKEELERAIRVVNTTRSRAKSVTDYLHDTQNCTRYLLHTGYKRALVSEMEKSFPLAFSLMVYKDAAQVERLLRAVYRPHNVYCVHVDRKSDDAFHTSIRLMISCLPNVVLADKSFRVEWGTATVLQPELECMKRLWKHSTKWRYFINLTGQEFPLKTNRELVTILRAFDGANDIGLEQDPSFVYRWKKQLPAPHNLTVTKAPVHIVASRGYVDYVIHSRVARDFLQWILPSSVPDESFFGTLNSNPHLGVPGSYLGSVNATNKTSFVRHKMWNFQNPLSCGGKWERQICHFGVGDLYRLTHSPQLFANKFSFDFMPLAYDCMEDWYFGKVDQENKGLSSVLNVSMYEDADFVRKQYRGPLLLWK